MEAINTFLQKELEYNMFDRTINNIHYWEYVRAIISCEVNCTISNSSKMFSKNKFCLRKFVPRITNIKKYFLKKRNVDILIVSQPRRIKTINGYKNNYIDYYVDILKNKYNILTIEEPTYSSFGISNQAHSFPIYTEDIYLTDFHEISFIVRKLLFKIFARKSIKKIKNEYNEINRIINLWYNVDNIEFEKYFIDSIIRLELDKKYIKKFIGKINPKILMLHYMPSIFKQMLIYECNQRHIPTIEIQHGTITKVDPLINKCLDVNKLKHDAKYIFSFGDNQVNKYALSIKDIKNIKIIGFPFFEEKLNEIIPKERKNILIISQSTIGDQIAEFTSKLAKLLKQYNLKIIFKYHPNELSKNYECLKKENIIEIRNEKNIYDIQNESFLQIGSYSTSLYEGFAMKIPTLVLMSMFGSVETIDIFDGISKGIYFINTPEEVLKYIGKKNLLPNDKDIKKLWANDSNKRLIKNIDKIMEEINNGIS